MNELNDKPSAWESSEKPEFMIKINMDGWVLLLSYSSLMEVTWSEENALRKGFLRFEFVTCSILIIGNKLEELFSHIQAHRISCIRPISPIEEVTATKKVG